MNLVTGGLGFIGNELVRQLKAAGEKVAIADNRNRVAPDIADLADVPVLEADVADRDAMRAVMTETKPRRVFHLAAIHYIPECNANPSRTLRVNVEGTQNVLDAASEANVEHLLFASSGAVYADSGDPLGEGAALGPVDIYGISKASGETLCRLAARAGGLRVTACRLFNNIGPRETNPHIVPEIVAQLEQATTIRLGNTSTVRDYVSTGDTARALIRLAAIAPDPYRVVNIATGAGASVRDLIAMIGDLLGRDIRVETDPARFRKSDKLVQVADVTVLRELLGWAPSADLRDSLSKLLQYQGLK